MPTRPTRTRSCGPTTLRSSSGAAAPSSVAARCSLRCGMAERHFSSTSLSRCATTSTISRPRELFLLNAFSLNNRDSNAVISQIYSSQQPTLLETLVFSKAVIPPHFHDIHSHLNLIMILRPPNSSSSYISSTISFRVGSRTLLLLLFTSDT